MLSEAMESDPKVRHNIRVHDKVASRYEKLHGEIYNPLEQERLRTKLALALSEARTAPQDRRALDFGSGAGNLTRHLLDLGLKVVSADVSPRFLELIRGKFASTGRLETMLLNGRDLAEAPSGAFDLAATYSVLHHVPDYLGAVAEMARVLKPGGILYLDHEVHEGFWNPSPEYREFKGLAEPTPGWTRYLKPGNYYRKLRLALDPGYGDEGDIHVSPEDHIEWGRIAELLREAGFEIVLQEDYLVYRRQYPDALFQAYRNRCSDMRLLIARKKAGLGPAR